MTRGTTSILYLFEGAFSLWRRRLKGVYAGARERGWHVEPVNADDEGVTSNAVLHFWRPDGVIVDGAALRSSIRPRRPGSRTRSRSSAASKEPLVLWGFFRQDLQDYGGVDNRNPDNPVNPVEKEIPDIGFRVLKLDSSSLRDTSGTFSRTSTSSRLRRTSR